MGPEWAEKPLMVQVAPAEASQAGSPQPAVAAAVLVGLAVAAVTPDQVQEVVELVVLVVLAVAQEEAPSMVEMMMTRTMIPTRGGKPATLPNHQGYQWLGRNLEKASPRMADSTLDQG